VVNVNLYEPLGTKTLESKLGRLGLSRIGHPFVGAPLVQAVAGGRRMSHAALVEPHYGGPKRNSDIGGPEVAGASTRNAGSIIDNLNKLRWLIRTACGLVIVDRSGVAALRGMDGRVQLIIRIATYTEKGDSTRGGDHQHN